MKDHHAESEHVTPGSTTKLQTEPHTRKADTVLSRHSLLTILLFAHLSSPFFNNLYILFSSFPTSKLKNIPIIATQTYPQTPSKLSIRFPRITFATEMI